jgi:hypothetical protein
LILDALLGVSFLTPLDGLFVLSVALPLASLLLTERRATRIRRLLDVVDHRRRAVASVVAALVTLSALVAVAAAQPVVIREKTVSQRADAEAFILFDTSLSMRAARGPDTPSRLQRAKRLAIQLQRALPDLPFGIAAMTDRSLPVLMPTTDRTLFERTVRQSLAVNEPPPSQLYKNRATTFDALIPLVGSRFYTKGVRRRLLIVYTDGESAKPSALSFTLQRRVTPVFVHVWKPGERIYNHGRADPRYLADPASAAALASIAKSTDARTFPEADTTGVARAARDAVGRAGTRTRIDAYARIALAPWFVLGSVVPLGFLLWRRNV